MRLPHAVLAALTLAALVAGCSSGRISSTPVPLPSAVTSPPVAPAPVASAPAPAPSTVAPAAAEVGDTLDLTGSDAGSRMAVVVTRVVDPAAAADDFSSPSPGDRLVSVQFRLRNVGSAVYSDAPSNGAEVIDSNGQGYDASFESSAAGPSFPGTTHIAPGDTALGYVTFEVPDGTRVAEVQFTLNSGFADDTGQWVVNRSVAGSAPATQAPEQAPAPPAAPAPAPQPSEASAVPAAGPRQVVESYFADINAGDYNGAWALGGKNLDHSYQDFTAGFAATVQDTVTVTSANGDTVGVSLDALQTDGSHRQFSGTYTVQDGVIVSASIR